MQVKYVDAVQPTRPFCELKVGGCYRMPGGESVYIKTSNYINADANAACLNTGMTYRIEPYKPVVPLEVIAQVVGLGAV